MKKALKIILPILGILLLVSLVVLYAIFPSETKSAIDDVWAFLNTPLPIIGVTSVAVLFFAYKVVVSTRYGKTALARVQNEYEKRYSELKVAKEELEQEKQANKEQIDNIKDYLVKVCSTIPNKKVNDLGDMFAKGVNYGEERIDHDTKEE